MPGRWTSRRTRYVRSRPLRFFARRPGMTRRMPSTLVRGERTKPSRRAERTYIYTRSFASGSTLPRRSCLAGTDLAAPRARTPHGSRQGTKLVKYMRSRPWRSRGPWCNTRAGARRRGYRDDELLSATSDAIQNDDDVVMHIEFEATSADDVLLPNMEEGPVANRVLAERIDLSGLLALAPPVPDRMRSDHGPDTLVGFDWHAHIAQSDGESAESRHSA
jgi:hypothetical protein